MNKLLIILVFLFLLQACASSNKNSKPQQQVYQDYITEHQLEKLNKIQQFRFQGWQPLDDRHLILSAAHKKSYLITLVGFCSDLEFANSIKLNQGFKTIVSSKFDSITVIDSNQHNQKCTIKTIHQLDKAQRKEVAALSRRS